MLGSIDLRYVKQLLSVVASGPDDVSMSWRAQRPCARVGCLEAFTTLGDLGHNMGTEFIAKLDLSMNS